MSTNEPNNPYAVIGRITAKAMRIGDPNIAENYDRMVRFLECLTMDELVAELAGWNGSFEFDRSKPDGTPRKLMDSSRLFALGWKPRIGLEEGIRMAYAEFTAGLKG